MKKKVIISGLTLLIAIGIFAYYFNGDVLEKRINKLDTEIVSVIGLAASDVSMCKTIAYGHKSCGGPVRYLIYSIESTDEKRLEKLVNEHYKAQKTFNRIKGFASTCDIETEPDLIIEDGECSGQISGICTNDSGEIEKCYAPYR